MRKLAAIAGIAAAGLGVQTTAYGYNVTADLTFSWGGANNTDIGWTSSGGTAVLNPFTNASYLSTFTGNNSTNYYNADFASAAQCATIVGGIPDATVGATRKYGCRYTDVDANPQFVSTPVADTGPVGPRASGTLTVTDTTMTGTLTIVATTDEPTGGTAASIGTGANGYNLRQADGSPFGNSWAGITTLGTYNVNLTGTFTDTSWQITGGSARFSDAGFLCQQGGNSSPANILCTASVAPGGYQTNGASFSWGWDPDGNGPGTTTTGIDVRDVGGALITTLSGVLANLSVDANGAVTTNSAEIRRGLGSNAGCGLGVAVANVTYNAGLNTITCGTITTSPLVVTGNVAVIPAPPAVWLLGTGVAALVARRRFKKAA